MNIKLIKYPTAFLISVQESYIESFLTDYL